jgi:hypothetical protein
MGEAARSSDDQWAAMVHLSNILSATVLFYAAVTRGALTVAWALGRLTRKA